MRGFVMHVMASLRGKQASRRQRRREFRDAINASYNRAGSDPEFQAEMRQLNVDFDAASADGLEDLPPGH